MGEPTILEQLEKIVGKENLSTEDADLLCYSRDASENVGKPDIIVWPSNPNQISEIMRLANRLKVPVTPRGAGTCLSGGSVPARGGILLVLTRMNSILKIEVADLQVLVECGVVWQDLNNALASHGLFLPPDPASGDVCTIGGCIAEGAGGIRAVKYGTFREWVLGLEVVLPTGETVWTGAETRKCASGYDLTRLLMGSEGTLGVITKAWLKVFPLPRYRLIMSAYFNTLEGAGKAVFQVISSGLSPSAAELMDRNTITAVSKYMNMGFPDCAAMLILEFDGSFLSEVKTRMRRAQKICKTEGATGVAVTDTRAESDRLWQARKSALPALATLKPTMKPSTMLEDVTVPISRVPEMLVQIERTAQRHGVLISTFGHAGDGNLHPVIIYDERSTEDVERARRAAADIFNFGLQLGGTLSGEHGIGLSKAPYFAKEHGEEEIEVMRRIKGVLDPKGILNPGKIWLEPR